MADISTSATCSGPGVEVVDETLVDAALDAALDATFDAGT